MRKMAQANFLFPGISTTKVDWEIMVDELSEPQTAPFDRIIGDEPPHSNGDGSEVQSTKDGVRQNTAPRHLEKTKMKMT